MRSRLALLIVLSAASAAACDSSPVRRAGVPPREPPSGELVALAFDIPGGRLLKAYAQALYQSRDEGRSWQGIPLPRLGSQSRLTAVAALPGKAGTLYVAGEGFGVMRTQDEGATWLLLDGGLPKLSVEALTVHASHDSTLFASVSGEGIFRTEDAGQTWTRMDGGPRQPVRQLFHSGLPGSMKTGWLYAATPDGVYRSMDCFCGWRHAGSAPDRGEIYSVTFAPDAPEQIFAAGAAGVA
ncbi:MAG: WD40/YVTN/BNR-like repeat-containing protein, partial [Gemmatimonadales bacterium]